MEKENARKWDEENDALLEQMEEWEENCFCSNQCTDWEDQKWCKHVAEARYRKFKKGIHEQLLSLYKVKF